MSVRLAPGKPRASRVAAALTAALLFSAGSAVSAWAAPKPAGKAVSPARASAGKQRPGAPKPGALMPELHMAVGQQNLPAVRDLLARGADPNAPSALGMTPLYIAGATGNVEIARALIDAGARVGAESMFGSPLSFATMAGQTPVARLLLARGARVDAARPDRISILMLVARSGMTELLPEVLRKGGKVNAQDLSGMTALMHAARMGHAEAARILLQAGASVHSMDTHGWTALMHAAVTGRVEVAKLLLEKGARPEVRDKHGRTALLIASTYGDHPEVVRALVKGGAKTDARDAKGRTSLAIASARGYERTAAALREMGAAAGPVLAAETENTPRRAVTASLPLIQSSIQVFEKRTGCVSCHHEGLARLATGLAKERGFSVDGPIARAGLERVLKSLEARLPAHERAIQDPREMRNVPGIEIGDTAPELTSVLSGIAAHGEPASKALSAAAMILARVQTPDGDWRFGFHRVPMQSSFVTMTALSIHALQAYAPKEHADETAQRIARAKQWLLQVQARDNEDRAFRLLGLKWAGATAEERRKALDELRAAQRPDGGWSQLETLQSDAYATGQALYALSQGGEVAVTDPVYQKGVRFLLRTQDDDGSWFVDKRAIPGNNYFDTGFPHGQSQYISHIGTCWATMALILAAEPEPARAASR